MPQDLAKVRKWFIKKLEYGAAPTPPATEPTYTDAGYFERGQIEFRAEPVEIEVNDGAKQVGYRCTLSIRLLQLEDFDALETAMKNTTQWFKVTTIDATPKTITIKNVYPLLGVNFRDGEGGAGVVTISATRYVTDLNDILTIV